MNKKGEQVWFEELIRFDNQLINIPNPQYVSHEMFDDALRDLQDDNEIVRTGNNIRRTNP